MALSYFCFVHLFASVYYSKRHRLSIKLIMECEELLENNPVNFPGCPNNPNPNPIETIEIEIKSSSSSTSTSLLGDYPVPVCPNPSASLLGEYPNPINFSVCPPNQNPTETPAPPAPVSSSTSLLGEYPVNFSNCPDPNPGTSTSLLGDYPGPPPTPMCPNPNPSPIEIIPVPSTSLLGFGPEGINVVLQLCQFQEFQETSTENQYQSSSSGEYAYEYEYPYPWEWDYQGGVFMNGDIGSTVGPVETGMPTMVYPQPVTTLAHQPGPGTPFPDSHGGINGVIMSQEPYGIASGDTESLESAEGGKRAFNSDAGQAQAQSGHTPDIPLEELKRMLLNQLEYYFSPENLASDKFLVSQMDSDHYVYISTLANFNMIKKLTSNIDLVTEVLRESKNVQVHADLKRVRPVSHRTVVILRGIAPSTSAEEIKLIFDNANCPKCTGCEFAFNDSWYVSFESDEDAMQAHRYIRDDVREFKGQPIMARIKSKPTTLLSQGVAIGVPTINKNGYSQAGVMPTYMPTAQQFVPANQQTSATATPAPLYATGQNVPSVFTLQNYPGFTHPWAGYYDVNSGGIHAPMFPVQPQASPGYPKSAQLNPRQPRNINPMRNVGPRRTLSSSSDTQTNVVVSGSNVSSNGHTGLPTHQQQASAYNSQSSRSKNGAPAPLLGMAPQPLVSHAPPPQPHPQPPQNHNHNHNNHHHHPQHQQQQQHNSLPPTSVNQNQSQGQGQNQPSNGRHYSHSHSSYNPSVPHNHNPSENYYSGSGSSRPYRGGGDSRPRSSVGIGSGGGRRGPRRDDDGAYEYPPAPSASSNYRGNPSTRTGTVPPAGAVSPQIPAQVAVNNQNQNHQMQIDLDLEGSAFPPLIPDSGPHGIKRELPGSAPSSKNGDSPYEGRLSDVVKGVKNMRVNVGVGPSDREKDDANEIVVSAAEPGSESSSNELVVSAASPQKDEEGVANREHSSHSHPTSKKEYREIGVGGTDENTDIHSSQSRSPVVSMNRQMADKSTRTDENLLNGEQSSGGGGGGVAGPSRSTSTSSQPGVSVGSGNNGSGSTVSYRKSVVSQSVSVGSGSKSPIPGPKRGVPPFQTASMGVGTEVPYLSASSRTVLSPVSSSTPANAKPFVSSPSSSGSGSVSSGSVGGPGAGRGANSNNVAKSYHPDNNSGGTGPATAAGHALSSGGGNGAPVATVSGSLSSATDKDAFPNFKSTVPSPTSAKPFSGLTDHVPKENLRSAEDRKESGQGDAKKAEDCSTGEGPVRLSYAQVAQSRKDAAAPAVQAHGSAPSSTTSTQGNSTPPNSNSSHSGAQSNALDERKRGPGPRDRDKDTKDSRAQSKSQRGNGDRDRDRGDRDRDRDNRDNRDRGFRRGYRSRVTSDTSDAGSNAGGKTPRGPKSPNK